MVLDHIADGADFFVKRTTPLYAEGLCLGDLHVVHKIAIPDRLQEGIGKAKVQQVLNSLLPQVVIDAKDGGLREDSMQLRIQRLSRGQVAAEGFLNHDSRIVRAARLAQSL